MPGGTMWLSRAALLLAIGSAATAILAGFGSRTGWWHFRAGFQILTWAAYGGLSSAVLGLLGAFASLWRGPRRGAWPALIALFVGLLVVWIPWQMKRTAQQVPAIHDITTDTGNPPRFVAVLPLRKDAPNSADYGGPDIAAQQRAAYPDLQPVLLPVPIQKTFAQALQAAEAMGWDIVSTNAEEGRIEATDTTLWFGFKDDVVVRIQARGDESLVDVRSVSRVGKSDVGTNAQRIRGYLQKLGRAGSPS
jgi:Uncharacterized protein conserved in bacteria